MRSGSRAIARKLCYTIKVQDHDESGQLPWNAAATGIFADRTGDAHDDLVSAGDGPRGDGRHRALFVGGGWRPHFRKRRQRDRRRRRRHAGRRRRQSAHAYDWRRSADAHLFGKCAPRGRDQWQYDRARARDDRSLPRARPQTDAAGGSARRGGSRRLRRAWRRRCGSSARCAWRGRRAGAGAMRGRHADASGTRRRWRNPAGSVGADRHRVDSRQREEISREMADQRRRLHARRGTAAYRRHHPQSGAGEILSPPRRRRSRRAQPRTRSRDRRRARSVLSRRYRARNRQMVRRQRRPARRQSDLATFTTKIEAPVSADYRGVTVHKCQPWSQGPVFLQQLRLLEGFDLAAMGHNSADYIHHLVEAAKLAFADREQYYGDPEFTRVPMRGPALATVLRTAPRVDRSAARLDGSAARRSDRDARAAATPAAPRRAHGVPARSTSPRPTAAAT